ncbi:MAG: hypothetical protein ACLTTW_05325 [Coprobacter sp.]
MPGNAKNQKNANHNCFQLPKYVIIVAGGKGLRMGGEIKCSPDLSHPVPDAHSKLYRYDPEINNFGITENTKIIGTTYVFNIDLL